jgi:3-dehydroquinate dehydratase/shikimate dehydrogenase
MERMQIALKGRPHWVDLEWEIDIPTWLEAELTHTRVLRSVHVAPGVFDIESRLERLPRGDAYKWVGHASRLTDNLAIKKALAWAKDRYINVSAFLQGKKGVISRCMQAAWGGSFTYAAPDNAEESASGQIKLETMLSWRCHRFYPAHGLCGVLGSPALQSEGPAFHNRRFQQSFKDLVYLPLEAETADEAFEAMKSLPLLGVSITMPLKETLPSIMNLPSPINTAWHRSEGEPWQWANTDSMALEYFLTDLPAGPVLVLGGGGVAKTSTNIMEKMGRPVINCTRRNPAPPSEVIEFAPVGVIQATSLGMNFVDPLPFPDILHAARPSLRWAVEWVNCHETAFSTWAHESGLTLVRGQDLFEKQATLQSRIFIRECGG